MECNFLDKELGKWCSIARASHYWKCDGPDCIFQRILAGQEKECKNSLEWAENIFTWHCPKHGRVIQ